MDYADGLEWIELIFAILLGISSIIFLWIKPNHQDHISLNSTIQKIAVGIWVFGTLFDSNFNQP